MEFTLSEKIIPYFQPIISLDTNKVYSYEVLGRYIDRGGEVKSLGAFFSDKTISNDKALRVDTEIVKNALKQYSEEGGNRYLFINLRLAWIANYADRPEEIPPIMWAKKYGVDLRKLVLEITEEEFNIDNQTLVGLMAFYKKIGCRIAIDDYGKRASNIDRLALISPDILKIDMDYIQKSEKSYHYRQYLKSTTEYAETLGIETLYEGIETQRQLDICINAKGRFYQGFLLAKPQPSISNAVVDYDVFSSTAQNSVTELHNRCAHINESRARWDARVEQFIKQSGFIDSNNGIIADINRIDNCFSEFLLLFPDTVKRIYFCNHKGEQISSNIEMDSENVSHRDYRTRNWSWRGYFQESIVMLKSGMKSHLTSVYRDVDTKEKIFTYVRSVDADLYLFIDIIHK